MKRKILLTTICALCLFIQSYGQNKYCDYEVIPSVKLLENKNIKGNVYFITQDTVVINKVIVSSNNKLTVYSNDVVTLSTGFSIESGGIFSINPLPNAYSFQHDTNGNITKRTIIKK